MTPLEHYAQLVAKVETFFDSVHTAHSESMQCASGCSDCCHTRLSITLVEAITLYQHLRSLNQEQQEIISRAALGGDPDKCSALDAQGRCRIYAARPLVCRSHGAPIRRREGSLPIVDACFRNFQGDVTQAAIADEHVLDQETLSTMLGAIDSAVADENGVPRGTRLDLAELLAQPGDFFGD